MAKGVPIKLKQCKICGDMFLPKTAGTKFCSKTHLSNCPICGKSIVWNSTRPVEPCSRECRKEQTKRNYIAKYGVDHPMKCKEVQQNHRAAMKAKYGVEHALQSDAFKAKASQTIHDKFGTAWAQSNKDIKAKSYQTMIEKYGAKTTLESSELKAKMRATMVERYGECNPSRIEEFRNKVIQTNLINFGVPNPMMNPKIAEKSKTIRYSNIDAITETIKATLFSRYGVDNPAKIPEVRAKISAALKKAYPEFKDKMIDTNIERYGVPYYCMTEECRILQGNTISNINKQFGEMLAQANVDCTYEYSILNYSYDLKVGNTLVEIDPTYTHNVIGNHWGSPISSDYHRNKTSAAVDAGFRCVHVFDWDDWDKVINIIKPPTTKLYARNCGIYKIRSDVGDEFLRKYHIQGTCRGQSLYLGLVHNDVLVELMTFGRPRYAKSHAVELLRLCTIPDIVVIGGASKLFKFAVNTYELSDVVSYCDLSKFSGKVYEKLGMRLDHVSPPQEIWSKYKHHITANLLRARGYDQLFGSNYGKGSDNEQLMLENGWLPVYDCGQAVYVYD